MDDARPRRAAAQPDSRTDRPRSGPSYETVLDRVIRDAMERGKFDDLPHRGRPLPPRDERAGEWTTAFEMLREAGVAPPWIEADKEARRRLEERDRLLAQAVRAGPLARPVLRRRMRDTVTAANRAIEQLNALAPAPRLHRRPLRLDAELAALEERFPPR